MSIKSFRGGHAFYNAGGGTFAVDDSCYLVLNQGREYSIAVDSPAPVESFCIFFADGFAAGVYRGLTTPAGRLLDPAPPAPVRFFERTYPHEDILSPALARLRAAEPQSAGRLEEKLHGIMERLLAVHLAAWREAERLPAVRASTREELYRRLHRARDYIAASIGEPIALDDMARAACLSPNHFLRAFKQLFHQTPHQYLTARRLERAQALLAGSDRSVTEISLEVGFESPSSFSTLFRRRVGVSPAMSRGRIAPA
ncbi:MAG: helix-turn-helix transcriptional regulator [Acidobacteria bacterium]|nr:helix-turn-helix transcriptional regulator [Acidobacteriota bacterium]